MQTMDSCLLATIIRQPLTGFFRKGEEIAEVLASDEDVDYPHPILGVLQDLQESLNSLRKQFSKVIGKS